MAGVRNTEAARPGDHELNGSAKQEKVQTTRQSETTRGDQLGGSLEVRI
jgi:hypothetical protein